MRKVRSFLMDKWFWVWLCVGAAAIFVLFTALGLFPTRANYCSRNEAGNENCSSELLVFYIPLWIVDHFDAVATLATAIATAFIARFTLTLKRSTDKLFVATKETAEAAKLSADAAVAIELPFIRVNPPDELTRVEGLEDDRGGLIWDIETPDLPEFSRIYEIEFRNIGRTTAAPTKLELGWKVALPLPAEEPVYTWSRRCDHGTVIPGDNEPRKLECIKFCVVLSARDREMISANAAALWIFGALTYLDFLDESHTSRFCWRWGCPDGVGLYHFYTDERTPAQYAAKS